MPLIKKQRPLGERPSSNGAGSVLDRISPLRDSQLRRMKVSIYGPPKAGKTRLACTFPKPLLVIGFEDGTASVAGTPGVDFAEMRSTGEIRDLTGYATSVGGSYWKQQNGKWLRLPGKTGEPYATVVLDNGTKMREMRIVELFAERNMEMPDRKPFLFADKAWKEVWNQCSQDLKNLLTPLFDAVKSIDLNVVVIAQEQVFGAGEESDGSEVVKPAIGSALGKGLSMWLSAECDYICHCFIRQQTIREEKVNVVSKKREVVEKKTGRMEFCLRIGPHETYVTGFRMPLGKPTPPDVLTDPSYEKIRLLLEG